MDAQGRPGKNGSPYQALGRGLSSGSIEAGAKRFMTLQPFFCLEQRNPVLDRITTDPDEVKLGAGALMVSGFTLRCPFLGAVPFRAPGEGRVCCCDVLFPAIVARRGGFRSRSAQNSA